MTPPRPAVRSFRTTDALWEKFTNAAQQAPETNASSLLRQFMRWYVGEPGAQLPSRPEPSAQDRSAP